MKWFSAAVLLWFSFFFSPTLAAQPIPAPAPDTVRQEILSDLKQLHEDFWSLRKLITRYGLEIVREKNFELRQEGKISGGVSGTLAGSGYQVQIGQLSNLLRGLGEVGGFMAASPGAKGLNGDAGLSELVKGLDHWGFGEMKLSGEIKGSLTGYFKGEGTGVVINKDPSAFYLFVRPTKLTKYREYLKYALTQDLQNREAVEEVVRFLNSPLLIDEKELNGILARRETILKVVESLELKLIAASASPELKDLVASASKAKEESQAWLRGKRILKVMAAVPATIRLKDPATLASGSRLAKLEVDEDQFAIVMKARPESWLRIINHYFTVKSKYANRDEGVGVQGEVFGNGMHLKGSYREGNRGILQAYLDAAKLSTPQFVLGGERLTDRLTAHAIMLHSDDSLLRRADAYATDSQYRSVSSVYSLRTLYREVKVEELFYKRHVLTFDGGLHPRFLHSPDDIQVVEVRLLPN